VTTPKNVADSKQLWEELMRRNFQFQAFIYLFLRSATAASGPGPHHYLGFTITLRHTHTHLIGLPWTSDQPDTETSTWQHTALITDRPPCPQRNSDPNSQQTSGRRPTS